LIKIAPLLLTYLRTHTVLIYLLISSYCSCGADAVVIRTQTLLCWKKPMAVNVQLLTLMLPLFLANWNRTHWRSFRRRQTAHWIQRGAHL